MAASTGFRCDVDFTDSWMGFYKANDSDAFALSLRSPSAPNRWGEATA